MSRDTKLYDILDVSPSATDDEIRKAYKKKALRFYPNKYIPEDPDKNKKLEQAYCILLDPTKRQIYDKYGLKVFDKNYNWNIMNIFLDSLFSFNNDLYNDAEQDSTKF